MCEERFGHNKTNHLLRVLEPLTGHELPAPQSHRSDPDENLALDPTGRFLAVAGPETYQTFLYQMPEANLLESHRFSVIGLSPSARWRAVLTPENAVGFVLKKADDPNWSLTLDIDLHPQNWPQFSPDGRLRGDPQNTWTRLSPPLSRMRFACSSNPLW